MSYGVGKHEVRKLWPDVAIDKNLNIQEAWEIAKAAFVTWLWDFRR